MPFPESANHNALGLTQLGLRWPSLGQSVGVERRPIKGYTHLNHMTKEREDVSKWVEDFVGRRSKNR